jgi:hypothetical protein
MPQKSIFIVFFSLLFAVSAHAQTQAPVEVAIESFWLARDDGNGKAGDETDVFNTTDIPIHCVVRLNSRTPATVKLNFVAVKVPGVKAETKVITVSYKTNGKQNQVYFTGKPDGVWTAGTYRIELFIDGKPGGSKDFQIQKTAQQIEKEKLVPTPKTNTKPKTARRLRKN